jgi:hypothetical protein
VQLIPVHRKLNGSARPSQRKKPSLSCLLLFFIACVTFFSATGLGAMAGYQSGMQEYQTKQTLEALKSLQEQYALGLQDLEAGRLDLARQRFEYVLDRDPNFPGAAENLIQVVQVLYATATPTAVPPTVTPTPTRDLRPVEDLFAQAQSDYAQSNWTGVIDVLLSLRKEDPAYRVVEVDSLLYRSLRHRGLKKIREEANLEGGMYDLSLAESFGPLDATAENWRNLARIYVIGLGFWEVHPELAVYYFGQVSAAAPGLRDASGWTASGRYWASLVQYGDLLASREDWCAAQEQYDAALARTSDAELAEKAANAQLKCSPPTNTPRPSATPTVTSVSPTTPVETPTATFPVATSTNTQPSPPSVTPGVTVQPTDTPTATQELPPTPTDTQPPPPTDTVEPTATEEPTATTAATYPEIGYSSFYSWILRVISSPE